MTVEAPVGPKPDEQSVLRSLLENATDGIVLIDEQAVIRAWNPSQAAITGLGPDQVLGESLFDVLFQLMPQQHRSVPAYQLARQGIREYLRSSEAPGADRSMDLEIVRPDGSRRTVEIHYFPIHTGSFRAGSITRDITDRRAIEQAEINTTRMKEEFIANVSHGLRSPLQGLIGNLELLEEVEDLDAKQVREALDRASGAAHRLAGLVEDITRALAFESPVALALEQVDLRMLIREAVESLKDVAAENGISIAFAPGADPPQVHASRGWLMQAVETLIRNAIRMSDAGSPVIITAGAQNGEVIVEVIDQGPGISREEEQAVFAMRPSGLLPGEDEPETRELELYLSRKIVEAHGGNMGVRSQLGVGSTFYFSLPAQESPNDPEADHQRVT